MVSNSMLGYQLLTLFTVLSLAILIFYFVQTLFGSLLGSSRAAFVAILFLALYLSQFPSVVEGLYWLPGIINYTWALFLLLAAVVWYLKLRSWEFGKSPRARASLRAEIYFAVGLSLLAMALAGLNETLILVELFLVGAALVFYYLRYRKIDWVFLAPILCSLICFWIVLKAPGNEVRAAQFHEAKNLSRTIGKSFGLSLEVFFRYLKPSFLVALFLSIPFILQIRPRIAAEFYSKKTRWLFALGLLGTLVIFLAPAQWAMGGGPPKRALNVLCFLHIVFVSLIFMQWVCARPETMQSFYTRLTGKGIGKRAWILIFALLLVLSGNHRMVWWDLLTKASTYRQETLSRGALIASSFGQDVLLTPYSLEPESLMFDDITEDPTDWRNTSVAGFFGLKSIRRGAK